MPKMTKLSVNVNKIATLRNARGGNTPDLVRFVEDCENFGAQGITVHPRPDERHVTLSDTYNLAKVIRTEYNIEGYPDQRYLKIISDIQPKQATLVPDAEDVIVNREETRPTIQVETLPKDSINLSDKFQLDYYNSNSVVTAVRYLIKERRLDTAVNKPNNLYVSLVDKVHKNRLGILYF